MVYIGGKNMKKVIWKGIICALIVVMLFPLNAVSVVEKIDEEINTTDIIEEWYIETVDSNGGGDISIALDSNNYPHITYFGKDDILYYAKFDGAGWNIESVDLQAGLSSSLSLDPNDIPHICYVDSEKSNLKYATKSGVAWKIQTVDSCGGVAFASMTLDSNDDPHIAYVDYQYGYDSGYDSDDGTLKYVVKTDQGWNKEILNNCGNAGFFTSISVGVNNQPYIFYDDWYEESLKMAKKAENQWDIKNIASYGSPTDSAIDPDGNLHVCYVDYSTFDLHYAYQEGSKWTIETVAFLDDVGFSSLCLDQNSVPYVSYTDLKNDVVKYTKKIENNWESEVVDEENVGFFTSLAIDSSGNSHIAYFDEVEVDLKYATTWEHNCAPSVPQKPSGPTEGKIGESYTYSTSTVDPNADKIKYGWDWNGDEAVDEWTDYYDSGEIVESSHSWAEMNFYDIRVKAQDEHGLESEWSEPLSVKMPKSTFHFSVSDLIDTQKDTSNKNNFLYLFIEHVLTLPKSLPIFNIPGKHENKIIKNSIYENEYTSQSTLDDNSGFCFKTNNRKNLKTNCYNGETEELILIKDKVPFRIYGTSSQVFHLFYHTPVMFENVQAPLLFENVWFESSDGEIHNFKVAHGYSGTNTLLDIKMEAYATVEGYYSSWSLIKSNYYTDLPDCLELVPEEQLPGNVKQWLSSTDFLQVDEGRIRMVAYVLRGETNNVNKIARRVATYTAKTLPYMYGIQDALTVLKKHGGVCTGRADLGAALMRVHDVPCRVLGVCISHFIMEYYAYPYGWVRVDTSMFTVPSPTPDWRVQYCAYPEDETTREINGLGPGGGLIAYWGTVPYVRWGITCIYNKWQHWDHKLNANSEDVDEAMSLTQEAWGYYHNYLGTDLSSQNQIFFDNAVDYELDAIDCFKEQNINGYIENMDLACTEFKKIG